MKRILILVGLVSIAAPASAQDLDAMLKWTSATVVHYRVVGEFSGDVGILGGVTPNRKASVTDHAEFELDWNQADFNLVGKPVIRNTPTRIDHVIPVAGCPAAKIDGPLEQLTLTAVRTEEGRRMLGMVMLDTKRDQPAGSYPYGGEDGRCSSWEATPARSETSTVIFQLPPGMMLVMSGGYKLTPDKKSFVVKDDDTGWTWTITPTIVR